MLFILIFVQVVLGLLTIMYNQMTGLSGIYLQHVYLIFIPSIVGIISTLMYSVNDIKYKKLIFWVSILTVPAWFLILYFINILSI